jgi:hypothetical protein
MSALDTRDLFNRLLLCQKSQEVGQLLSELGDDEGIGLEEPFGTSQLKWTAFGGTASNISTVGIATKPGKSLTERLTNAMDALLEDRAEAANIGSLPTSPREAAQTWFKRPMTGPETGLFQATNLGIDRKIALVLLNSGEEERPTIDVLDQGVGLRPEQLRTTILSLQGQNKIKKRHQIGAFGQGGASTLGFADYVFIASRYRGDTSRIGFTVIRVLRLDTTYKEDCYAYLVTSDSSSLEAKAGADEEQLTIYSPFVVNAPTFGKGTLVRHFGYRLSGVSKALSPSPGNLYHYLHYSLLDPLLPFRIWDMRNPASYKEEYVGGSRNRLMRLVNSKNSEGEAGGRVQVRHHRPMEFIVPSGGDIPCIGVEYWVVFAYRKRDKDGSDEILRGNSAELFVHAHLPIIGTLNGQTQGELSGSIFRELGLVLLSRHIVVHIDASEADSGIRRQLFSTSREGFKEGPVLDSIVANLRRMLEEDVALAQAEQELTERLAKRETASTKEEVRQQVTKLLKEVGLDVSESAKADIVGDGDRKAVVKERRHVYVKHDPLETLPFPQVTFLRFSSPDQHLEVSLQDSQLVLLETDADAEFDRRGLLAIRSSEDILEIESKARLAGGRVRWRLRPSSKAIVGQTGEVTASITKPNGEQVTAAISFEVLAPKERPVKTGKTSVPPFEIKAISPLDEEDWERLWPEDMGNSEQQFQHAYKAIEAGGKTWVYYSTVFPAYSQAMEKLKANKSELVHAYGTSYEVWIAYHAILQKQAEAKPEYHNEDSEKLTLILDMERAVVATMQVKQALQFAETWKKGLTASHSS